MLAERAEVARSLRARLRGLIGRSPLGPGEALVIERCPQVHTFFMGYPIDVVFCASDWTVLHVVRALPPRRLSRWVSKARYAVELPAGSLPAGLCPGDRLEAQP